jgi:hypothetical protein
MSCDWRNKNIVNCVRWLLFYLCFKSSTHKPYRTRLANSRSVVPAINSEPVIVERKLVYCLRIGTMRREELAEIILIGAAIAPLNLKTDSRIQNVDAASLTKSIKFDIWKALRKAHRNKRLESNSVVSVLTWTGRAVDRTRLGLGGQVKY